MQRLAAHLDIAPKFLVSYGDRDQTRTDHLVEVAKLLGWRAAGDVEFKELDQFLAARALEHDSPTLLFRLACDYLRSARVIRPGPEWLSRRGATAREGPGSRPTNGRSPCSTPGWDFAPSSTASWWWTPSSATPGCTG